MKTVKCKSGIIGWQCRLQESYKNLEEFKGYCESHNIAERLGFASPKKAWEVNPVIQGSTEPSDLCTVLGEHGRVEFVREEVEGAFKKFLSGKSTQEQLVKKLNKIDNSLKRLLGSPNEEGFWFRFFSGDTGAHDAREVERDLTLPASHSNHKYMMECIELGVGVEGLGMVCYYS